MEIFLSLLKKLYLLNKPRSLLFAHYSTISILYFILNNIILCNVIYIYKSSDIFFFKLKT